MNNQNQKESERSGVRVDNIVIPPEISAKSLQSIYKKGYIAAMVGKTVKDNPYRDQRTFYGRTFLKMWRRGYDDYTKTAA
jgi:hypothetical protein